MAEFPPFGWPRGHWRASPGPFYFEVWLDAVNIPRVSTYWLDDIRSVEMTVSWGNGNSDPVWMASARLSVPRWLARRLIRVVA